MVGLIRRYSNQNILARLRQVAEQVEASPRRKPTDTARTKPHKLERRLSPETLSELVAAYRQGTSSLELCKRYNLGKGTVLKILSDHDVPMRVQPHLTELQIDKAVDLYKTGDSLATIAKQMGSAATTIRRALQERGVGMRPPGGSLGRIRPRA